MMMPRPVECISPGNAQISLCGELTTLRAPQMNGKGTGWNIQMVFSRDGAHLAGVCFPPNVDPEGNRFMENLQEGRFYVLQKYSVGDSSRSPMENNMADNVVLDWRYPIEEVPFEKVMENSQINSKQREFNRELNEAENKKVKEQKRDPGLYEKRKSLETGQGTVDGFITTSSRERRSPSTGRGSPGRRRTPSRDRRWSPREGKSRSRERRRSPGEGGARRLWSRSRTRERSTLKASWRVSRS